MGHHGPSMLVSGEIAIGLVGPMGPNDEIVRLIERNGIGEFQHNYLALANDYR